MKEKRERARKRRKGKEKERERKETERHIFDFSELYWSVPSRWNCVEISWSTCSGSSAGADSREGRAVPIWSRRRRSTLTSTCIEGGGEALAAGRRVRTWRRRSWWEKGWVFHIGGDVETLDFPRPAACPPAHCASSGSPAEQPNLLQTFSSYRTYLNIPAVHRVLHSVEKPYCYSSYWSHSWFSWNRGDNHIFTGF